MLQNILIKHLGCKPYQDTWEAMKAFTNSRDTNTPDEIWCLEHPPVFTLGLAGKAEHLLQESDIPVIKTDRGGQITYHGPGQLIAYVLLDLHRHKLGIKSSVCLLEQSLIDTLATFSIKGHRRDHMPGVYVDNKKIASIGLKVRKGCTYHGISLNVNMDLSPFELINTCGYEDLEVTQIANFVPGVTVDSIAKTWGDVFLGHINALPPRGSDCGIQP